MSREELIARLHELLKAISGHSWLIGRITTGKATATIEAALTALQDREAVVRECAAVCDQVNVEYEEHPEMALTCRSAILKLLEPK